MPLISIPEVRVYKRIQVKVQPRPDVPGAKPWMTSGELMLLKAQHDRRRIRSQALKALGLGIVALVGLLVLPQTVIFTAPTDAVLTDLADRVAHQALREFTKPTMPLATSTTTVALEQKTGFSRQLYRVTVSLRLLQPLYVTAHSNGTLEYEQLRLGLAVARARPPLENRPDLVSIPPELPQLVQRSHFAGETTRITTTVEARRSGWRWKFAASDRFALVCRRPFQGAVLHSFGNVAVYDELRPDPALTARLDEVRSYLRRRAGVISAAPTIRGALP